jgi:hypothetical protein
VTDSAEWLHSSNRTRIVRLLLAFILCLVYATPAVTSPADERKTECAKTKEKIRRIESKMRHGYTASQGIKMEDELRRLRERRARTCR